MRGGFRGKGLARRQQRECVLLKGSRTTSWQGYVPQPPTRWPAAAFFLPSPPLPTRSYREAVYSFQAAVRVQAADPLAHFRIGNALFALKKYPEARKVCGIERDGC